MFLFLLIFYLYNFYKFLFTAPSQDLSLMQSSMSMLFPCRLGSLPFINELLSLSLNRHFIKRLIFEKFENGIKTISMYPKSSYLWKKNNSMPLNGFKFLHFSHFDALQSPCPQSTLLCHNPRALNLRCCEQCQTCLGPFQDPMVLQYHQNKDLKYADGLRAYLTP